MPTKLVHLECADIEFVSENGNRLAVNSFKGRERSIQLIFIVLTANLKIFGVADEHLCELLPCKSNIIKVLEFVFEGEVFFIGYPAFQCRKKLCVLYTIGNGGGFFLKQLFNAAALPILGNKPLSGEKIMLFLHHFEEEMVFAVVKVREAASLGEIIVVEIEYPALDIFGVFHQAADICACIAVTFRKECIDSGINIFTILMRLHNTVVYLVNITEGVIVCSVYAGHITDGRKLFTVAVVLFNVMLQHYGQLAKSEIFTENIRLHQQRILLYLVEEAVFGQSERPVKLCPLVHNDHLFGYLLICLGHHLVVLFNAGR